MAIDETPLTEALGRDGVLPVLTIASAADASALADGLGEGGFGAAEVTMRTSHALAAIRVMTEAGILVGAGTVLSVADAERARDAGAAFLVSPGTTLEVVEWCLARDVVIVPGVATPSEAMRVRDLGITTMKFFPAEAAGGSAWLHAIAGPLPDLRFVATGGIREAALPGYLAAPNLLAAGGSWFLPESLTAEAIAHASRSALAGAAALRSARGGR